MSELTSGIAINKTAQDEATVILKGTMMQSLKRILTDWLARYGKLQKGYRAERINKTLISDVEMMYNMLIK